MQFIALRTVRYSDTHAILTALSAEMGRVSLQLPDGAGKGARRIRALTMPMAQFEAEIHTKPGRDIHRITDVKASCPAVNTVASPLRGIQAMFMADFLCSLVRESIADNLMYGQAKRISDAIETLSEADLSTVHITGMIGLMQVIGILPDSYTYRKGAVFDIRDGVWRPTPPLHNDWLDPRRARIALLLSQANFSQARRLLRTRADRATATDVILRYFNVHMGINSPSSLQILKSL